MVLHPNERAAVEDGWENCVISNDVNMCLSLTAVSNELGVV